MIAVWVLALALRPPAGEAASITARITEAPGGGPLAAAELVAVSAADSHVVAHGSSAPDGRVRLDGLGQGRYRLRASLLGHAPWVRSDVTITRDTTDLDLGTIVLSVVPVSMSGVTTTTERPLVTIAADRTIYYAKDQPVAVAGTAADLLRTVPELDVDLDGHVTLRGSGGVRFQFDGRTAPLQGEALSTYLRQTPAGRIERIEVVPNPSARYDPEGVGGIVNIVFKAKASPGVSGSLSLNGGTWFNGPGARIAWQRGPLTCFGGISGGLGRPSYFESSYFRQSLVDGGASTFRSQSLSRSHDARYYSADASADLALSKRLTLYGNLFAYPYSGRSDATADEIATDSTRAPFSAYVQSTNSDSRSRSGSGTLGLQQVVQAGRNERTIEYLQSMNDGTSSARGLQRTSVPAGAADLASIRAGATGEAKRSLEAVDTHPFGTQGKVESGLQVQERITTSSASLTYAEGGEAVVTPLTSARDGQHRERFASAHATVTNTFGRLSIQAGARFEQAHTTLDARVSGRRFTYDYRSVFPSANAAWSFGRGMSVRVSYSRRIDRPGLSMLDPDALTPDSLNRSTGNPGLGPKFTNSWSLDASWSGSRGLLRLSPFYRRTVDNWEQWTAVAPGGAAITTWINASSVDIWGATGIASLRQTGKLATTLTVSLVRERHDAGGDTTPLERSGTSVSVNGNGTYELSKSLALQGYARVSPAQTTAQGRTDAFAYTMLGGRIKHGEKLSLSVWARDPFNLAHTSGSSSDATFRSSYVGNTRGRGFSATLSWLWGGRPPQQKPRLQSEPTPSPENSQGP